MSRQGEVEEPENKKREMITVTNQGLNEVALQGPGSEQPTVFNRGWPLLSHAFDDHTFS